MSLSKTVNSFIRRQDLIHLAILLVIALGIGVYIIATTVVIAKDGVFYIQQAVRFSSEPQNVIKGLPCGYPFLIFAAHKLAASLSGGSSLFTWIYSAQSITLLCQLLALIPLYFIGKLLVGGRRSFQAIFILIILPYPAEFVSDILREWPHMLFLASGFLFLIRGAKEGKCWMFGAAGLAAGLGHIIRPECGQLIIYGALWIVIRLFSPKPPMSRPKLLCALSVLLIGFAIPAAPYMTARGQFLPAKLKALISSTGHQESEEIREPETDSGNKIYLASVIPGKIAKAIGKLAGVMSENLMYFFVPPLLIGIYFRFRKKSSATEIERFFVPAFVALNVVMLITLYYSWGYISRRHCFPLVVFTIFYVPIGLEVWAGWLADRFSKSRPASDKDRRLWFLILLITGTAICMPKLFKHPGQDKQGYRTAAAWLSKYTAPQDLIAVPDSRITFYAERKGLIYDTATPATPTKAKYVVIIVRDESEKPDFAKDAKEEYSAWVDEHKKNKKLIIYKMPI